MVVRLVFGNTVLLALSRRCCARPDRGTQAAVAALVVRVLNALSRVNALSGALAAGFGRALLGSVLRVL